MPVLLTSISPCLVQYLAHTDARLIIGFEETVSNHFLSTMTKGAEVRHFTGASCTT